MKEQPLFRRCQQDLNASLSPGTSSCGRAENAGHLLDYIGIHAFLSTGLVLQRFDAMLLQASKD